MDILTTLNLVLMIIIIIMVVLAVVIAVILIKNKMKKDKAEEKDGQTAGISKEKQANLIPSVKDFMEFDDIIDNMIVRKNRQQYNMVIQCQGINYDLLPEEEKIAVENGFVQFLNTLRFPIQLYVQTRNLNLKDTIDEYKTKMAEKTAEVDKIDTQIKQATAKGNVELANRLKYDRLKKNNVIEYGADIIRYVERMSLNENVQQQKNYIIVSYFTNELGNVSDYSKEEIDNMCFSELYTRTNSVIRSLASAEVMGRVLDSEELAELLYMAYNRDEAEVMNFNRALDAQYDRLYSTGKDTLQKKQELIDEQIAVEAVNLATESLKAADEERKKEAKELEKRKQKVKEEALGLIEEYKDQMDNDLYQKTKKQINKRTSSKETNSKDEEKKNA